MFEDIYQRVYRGVHRGVYQRVHRGMYQGVHQGVYQRVLRWLIRQTAQHRIAYVGVLSGCGCLLAMLISPWTMQPAIAAIPAASPSRLGLGLGLMLGLIVINAFFVMAEFAMVSARRSRIDRLVEDGDRPAKTVQVLQQDLDLLLSATQLGITLSSLALGWIGERTMAMTVLTGLQHLPFTVENWSLIAHTISIPVAFLIVAYLQIVLGELCPKSLALLYPEQLARLLGPPSLAIARCFSPFLWILNQSTRLLLRPLGVNRSQSTTYHHRFTSEELQQMIADEAELAGLEAEEREWLSNIFEFGDVLASEIMIPRTQIEAIAITATLKDVFEEVAETCHSRYPVIGESLDDIRGIICVKDLAEPLTTSLDHFNTSIGGWMIPARFVAEYTPLSELLPQLQRSPQQIAIVVDEFGGTAGLVTLQDVIAEIIGESEADLSEEPNVEFIDDHTFSVRAQLHVEEVNELLELNLPLSEEYQTLAGFMIYQLQKIPDVGEKLRFGDLEISVKTADGPRLQRLYIRQFTSDFNISASASVRTGSRTFARTIGNINPPHNQQNPSPSGRTPHELQDPTILDAHFASIAPAPQESTPPVHPATGTGRAGDAALSPEIDLPILDPPIDEP